MAADSDGVGASGKGSCGVVVTCEGDLRDPRFPARLRRLLRELRTLLAEPHPHTLKVNKVEPWNSVRVTLSVPRAAAARLRALAAAGAPQLRALGILSVQLDGDAAVSLRLQHGTELRINTDNSAPDDASTSRAQPNAELLAGLGGIGRLLEGEAPAEPQPGPAPRDNFKSPNTVCPMDGKIPQNIVTHATDRCEFPFGSMTQARVIHRKENTLGLTGPTTSTRPASDGVFARPSTSSYIGPPPPYPAQAQPSTPQIQSPQIQSPQIQSPQIQSPQIHSPQIQSPQMQAQIQSPQMQAPQSPAVPSPAPPTVAMSSPLLVNLLQNDAPAPQPRAKPPHPAKLDRLEDGQVELAVGRAPFEYRARPQPRPPPSPVPRAGPRLTPYIRRAFPARPSPPVQYRAPAPPNTTVIARSRFPQYTESFAPPPPYRQARPPRPPPARVTQEDLQALLPPTTTMDQKTQSSFQEFQRYQQQYIARQRAASRTTQPAEWNEPYRDLGLTLGDLPDSCDLDQLLPTLEADLDLGDISDLDGAKLDFYDQPSTSNDAPEQALRDIQYPQTNGPSSSYEPVGDVPSKRDTFDEASFMPPPPVPQPKFTATTSAPFKSPPNATYSPSASSGGERIAQASKQPVSQQQMVNQSIVHTSMAQTSMAQTSMSQTSMAQSSMAQTSMAQSLISQTSMVQSSMLQTSMVQSSMAHSSMAQSSSAQSPMAYSSHGQPTNNQHTTIGHTSMINQAPTVNQQSTFGQHSSVGHPSSISQAMTFSQPMAQSSMPPPSKVPARPSPSVSTATVGSQATQREIEEQSKQYLIKTLMRDDDTPPPTPKEEKKPEEVTVANCNLEENVANAIKEVAKESSPAAMPEMFGIAKSIPEEDVKREDDKKNRLVKKEDKSLALKGGKPRTTGAKEKPSTLKDRIVRDGKSTKVAVPRLAGARAGTEPAEKESIKLRLKLDKNEPVVQPVYKADVSFVNQKGDKPTDTELRVPPLHISLRGRNSAVIKNSKKEKKKFSPGDVHSKKFKRKTLEDEKAHRRESGESAPSKSGEDETDEYLNSKDVSLDFHYPEGDAISEITGDNNVVYRMKTISKNAHIVTKHDYKTNNRVPSIDLKMKKKLKMLSDGKPEKERDREWRNDALDKEGKYAQNEGYREMNNHEVKKKLPVKVDNGANCDSKDGAVQSDVDSEKSGASDIDSRLLKCHKGLDWTLGEGEERRNSEGDNKLKRTITESAITSPNGLLTTEKKRKTSHSSCPEPATVGSTNVGTIAARADSPPAASSQRGGASPRRKERPKDKSYCKLVAERAAEFGARSPAASAQGEDSGIESMDALSEKSPNQASQSPPGPARKERLDMPRSTSPGSVQRIIGVAPPPSDELLERLARAAAPPRHNHCDADTRHHAQNHLGDIEAELAKMHAEHDPRRRAATPILRDPSPPEPPTPDPSVGDFDPPPTRVSPPLYTYSNQEKTPVEDTKDVNDVDGINSVPPTPAENGETVTECESKPEPLERLPLKADFPDKSLLEQLLIDIPTPDYSKRAESPSPSALERVARSSVRTRSSSKLSSPADGPRTPRLSPGVKVERADSPAVPKNCIREDKTSPRATVPVPSAPSATPATLNAVKPAPAAKRKRRESESSCASTISCEEGVSPGRKKKPRWGDGARPAAPQQPAAPGVKVKKDSDSDSDEPLICKVRGKTKAVRGVGVGAGAAVGAGAGAGAGAGVGTRRSGRHGAHHPPPAPPNNNAPLNAPLRRKTRSAVGEGPGAAAGTVRRRRASRDGK